MKELNCKFYNRRAEDVARELLGKIICYNGKKCMITVTEAYPYDEKDENGEILKISYVNRSDKGKGHDLLTGTDKIGKWFVFGVDMLHIACAGGTCILTNGKEEYHCDNVLIRGALEVKENGAYALIAGVEPKPEIGCPYILCHDFLELPSDNSKTEKLIVYDFKSFADGCGQNTRVNINDQKKYRYYVKNDDQTDLLKNN